jgi:hypothetical protein
MDGDRMLRKLLTQLRSSWRPKQSVPYDDSHLCVPIDDPEVLDRLWGEFIDTGDEAAVRRIVSVLDWDDLVRIRLQAWLSGIRPESWSTAPHRDYQQLLVACCFPIDYDNRSVDGPVDLDIHVALLARSHKLKFADLPIPLSPKELVRLAMKSAALWSLLAMAKQHEVVAQICETESKRSGGAARLHLAAAARRPPGGGVEYP